MRQFCNSSVLNFKMIKYFTDNIKLTSNCNTCNHFNKLKKVCFKCKEEKYINCFTKSSKNEDGYFHICKKCRYGYEPRVKYKPEKICNICNKLKPINEYHLVNRKLGFYSGDCKICYNLKRTSIDYTERDAKRPQELKQQYSRNSLLKKYKLSNDQYNKMVEEQKGLCYICNQEPTQGKKLSIDHCHTKGNVRKLLCNNCNLGLGNFKDNPKTLQAAIKYLELFVAA